MFSKILNFIKYNNAFSIGVSLVFLATSVSFAASEDLRGSIVDSQEVVKSVDNTFIISADIDNFDFNLQINDVVEDNEGYLVSYSYQTIAIDDYVWKIVPYEKTLNVSKAALESSYIKDLGLYVEKNLSDNIEAELYYLKKVQSAEQLNGVSQKVVATEYTGLIGKRLSPRQRVFEGYSASVPTVERDEGRRRMDPSEISARTREVLLERKKKEIEERIRLEEEMRNATTTDPIIPIENGTTTPPVEPPATTTPPVVTPPPATTTPPVVTPPVEPPPVTPTTPEVVEPTPEPEPEVVPPPPEVTEP